MSSTTTYPTYALGRTIPAQPGTPAHDRLARDTDRPAASRRPITSLGRLRLARELDIDELDGPWHD